MGTRMFTAVLSGALVVSIAGPGVSAAVAAPLVIDVDTVEDVVDGGDGLTSLREAIAMVEAEEGLGHRINLPAGTYVLKDDGLTLWPANATGVEIVGAGMGETVIMGNDAHTTLKLMGLSDSLGVLVSDLTITGGRGMDFGQGGGVQAVHADVVLARVRVTENHAVTGAGVSASGGELTLADSLVDGNVSASVGGGVSMAGGILLDEGDLTIERSRFSRNEVNGDGSQARGSAMILELAQGDVVSVTDTTVDQNTLTAAPDTFVSGFGSTIHVWSGEDVGEGAVTFTNSTIVDNVGPADTVSTMVSFPGESESTAVFDHVLLDEVRRAFEVRTGLTTFTNSVISADDAACTEGWDGTLVSGGGNVFSDDTCSFAGFDDIVDVGDVGFGSPQALPATSAWAMPEPSSPAIDAGVALDVDVDARGTSRPQGVFPDAGPVELLPPDAVDDEAATDIDKRVEIDVLANDGPGEAAAADLTVRYDGATSGSAIVTDDGLVRFTPATGGVATLTVRTCVLATSLCDESETTVTVTDNGNEPLPPEDGSGPGPDPDEAGVVRRAGADRFDTAARASAAAFLPGVDLAFIATGADFPDALAGAPLAARNKAPILLTRRDALPDPTLTELRRLAPRRIVVLGGAAAVSDEVLAILDGLASVGSSRIAGDTRFSTAQAIAEQFPVGSPVYLATGANFPDALAGAAAAGRDDVPILLVRTHDLPDETAEALFSLDPPAITVLGGRGVISDFLTAKVEDRTDVTPSRIAGSDRFDTSARVAAGFASADTVYVATGLAFPDALAAGPIAGAEPAPILLTRPDALPASVAEQLERLSPARIVIVGGASAVSIGLEQSLKAYLGS